jgi:hypothetical protein
VNRIQSTNLTQDHLCFANFYCCLIWFWTRSGSSPPNWHVHIKHTVLYIKITFHYSFIFDYIMTFPFTSRNFAIFSSRLRTFLRNHVKFCIAKFRIYSTSCAGGTGFQHVCSMTLGFAIFLPSLYFRETFFIVLKEIGNHLTLNLIFLLMGYGMVFWSTAFFNLDPLI